MEIEGMRPKRNVRLAAWLGLAALFFAVWGCAVRPRGIVYTNMRLPLTRDLHHTPTPMQMPNTGRTLEIKEPITGVGLYVQVDSNAIGDIARKNGMQTLYFADRQFFSILGIWTTDKTILYGE
jgi:hypothetical protein